MQPNLQETADSVAFTEEIPNEKLFCALYVDSVFFAFEFEEALSNREGPIHYPADIYVLKVNNRNTRTKV